jgi:transposase
MRENVSFDVSPSDRQRLLALVSDRNTPAKVVWRAEIILATADGLGTMAIMRTTGKSKPCVWRWQERYAAEGVDGLTRDKTRPPGTPPLSEAIKRAVLANCERDAAACDALERAHDGESDGYRHTSVQRIWRRPA